jgi:hypothetical protein
MNYIVLKIMHELAGLRLFYHQFGLYMLTDQQAVMLLLCSLTASDIGVDGELGESGEEKYMMLADIDYQWWTALLQLFAQRTTM